MLVVCDTCSHKRVPLVNNKHRTYMCCLILLELILGNYLYRSSNDFKIQFQAFVLYSFSKIQNIYFISKCQSLSENFCYSFTCVIISAWVKHPGFKAWFLIYNSVI